MIHAHIFFILTLIFDYSLIFFSFLFSGILLGLTFLVVTGTVVDIAHAYEVSHRPVRLLHKSDSEGSHIINANDDFSSGVDSLIEADGSGQPDDRPPWERPPKRSQLKNVLRNDPGKN